MHAEALAAAFRRHSSIAQLNAEAVTLALDLPGDDDHLKAIVLAGAIAQLAWLAIDLKQGHRQRFTVVA